MKYRQYATYLITLVFAGLFSCANPTEPTGSPFTVTIKGNMVRINSFPLDSVQMVLSNPFRRDSSKSGGLFLISFTSVEKNPVTGTLAFSRTGFYDTTRSVTYSSTSKDIDLQAVAMKGLTSAQDSVVPRPSQRPGSVVYIGTSSDNLSILGAGGKDAAVLTFEVRDSLGAPVDTANQLNVQFKFINRPDLNTQLNRDSARTNSSGRVTVQLSSGLKSGLASVQAIAAIKNKIDPTKYDTIKSQVVSIPIFGGFPDSAHFSIGSEKYNIPGAVLIGLKNKISVLVGDKYGNPVRPGTPVIFNSTGGVIDGKAVTADDGSASVDLTTGNPVPANGFAWVKAQVATGQGAAAAGLSSTRISKIKASGDAINVEAAPKLLANHLLKSTLMKALAGSIIGDSIPILFSGKTVVGSLVPSFIIPVGSSTTVNFTVSDPIGNPLTSGTTIKVTASGAASSDVELTGNVDLTLPDTQDPKYTSFSVDVKDKRTTGLNQSKKLALTIEVTSQNGNDKKTLQGDLSGTGGISVDSSIVGRIALQNPTPDSVVVAGVGGIKTKDALFKVYNTFGLPAKNVLVTFSFSKSLGGGEYLSPTTALSDTGGNVKTTLTSGTSYGEVRIVATAKSDSLTISSDQKVIYIIIPANARLASQIAFLGATESDIFVAGVGSKENSTLTYEVRDSLGFPIDRQRRVFVTYTVQFFPNTFSGGGTAPVVIPSTDSTDDQGKTRTTVASGTQAGVVQIVVNIQLSGRPLLVSQPVRISVHAGFADQKHFTIAAQANFPGLDKAFQQTSITVQVADKYSNPVLQGTAVYFNSSHGTMQTGGGEAGLTDVNGFVTKALYSANPFPVPPDTLPGMASGFSRVYARTIGKDSTRVMDSVQILWTGSPIITMTGGPASFAIPNGGSAGPYTFTVLDRLGHPMSPGTGITVTADACTVNGDANISMPDTQVGGPGLTSFTVLLKDSDPTNTPPTPVPSVLTVVVTHPVYGTGPYKLVLASGTVN